MVYYGWETIVLQGGSLPELLQKRGGGVYEYV